MLIFLASVLCELLSFGYFAGYSDVLNTRRLHFYSMYYLDVSSWKQCYRDQTPRSQPIPMPSTVPCNGSTQYIHFFTTEPDPQDKTEVFLEICEVEIYGL